jgi:hypothetical protein
MPSDTSQLQQKLMKRMRSYWKMECANIVVVPGLAIFLTLRAGGSLSLALWLSLAACSFLLFVGTFALKMISDKLHGQPETERTWVPRLKLLRWPALLMIGVALLAIGREYFLPTPTADLVAASIVCLLAILEYINYYHVQLQHFDNAADWQRLISGKGFRRSHLSRSIAAWQNRQASEA